MLINNKVFWISTFERVAYYLEIGLFKTVYISLRMSSSARYLAVLVCFFQALRLMEGIVLNGKESYGRIDQTSTLICTDGAITSSSGFIFAKNGLSILTHNTVTSKYNATRNAGFIEINIHTTSVVDEGSYTCSVGFAASGAYTFQVEKRFADINGIGFPIGDGTSKKIRIKFDGLYPSPTLVTVTNKDGLKELTGTPSITPNGQFFNFEWTSSDTFAEGQYVFTVHGTTRTGSPKDVPITVPGHCWWYRWVVLALFFCVSVVIFVSLVVYALSRSKVVPSWCMIVMLCILWMLFGCAVAMILVWIIECKDEPTWAYGLAVFSAIETVGSFIVFIYLLCTDGEPAMLLRKMYRREKMDEEERKRLAAVLVLIFWFPLPLPGLILLVPCCIKRGRFVEVVKMFWCHKDG